MTQESPVTATAPLSPPIDDSKARAVELLISHLLRACVVSSLALVLLGTILSFVHHPDYNSSPAELRRLTTPGAAFPHTLKEVLAGLRNFRGQAVVVVGLMLLIATPVLRVAVSILAFLYEGDRPFVLITTVVLTLLLLSFFLGRVEG